LTDVAAAKGGTPLASDASCGVPAVIIIIFLRHTNYSAKST